MIQNDLELEGTQERIAYFQRLLAQFRVRATPEEFPSLSSAYLAEVEKMHQEVMDYLGRHASLPPPAPTPSVPELPAEAPEPAPQPRQQPVGRR